MMKRLYLFTFFFSVATIVGFTQNSNEDWVTYVVEKEKGPMTVTTNLYYNFMGKPNYKNLLVVGTSTRNCLKNGYPDEFGLSKFYMFSDSISAKLSRLTKKRLVGILTYQCSGFDVYYIKDTTNVRATIQHFLDYNYAFSKNYLMLKEDKKWSHYKENLIPKEISDGFFMNHEFLNQLIIEGDDISKPRKVAHWINFRNEKRRERFISKVKPLEFAIDSVKYIKGQDYKYQVRISRKDSIHPSAISKLTEEMVKLSKLLYGIYEGWGADPIEKD